MALNDLKEKRKERVEQKSVAKAEKNVSNAPYKLNLVITVVDRRKGEYYADFIQSFDVNFVFGTIANGLVKDTSVLEYFGFNNSTEVAIFSVVKERRTSELMEALDEKFKTVRGGKGVAISIPFSSVIGKFVYGFLTNDERMIQEDNRNER